MKTIFIKLAHSPADRFTGLDRSAAAKLRRLHRFSAAEFHGLVRCVRIDSELCVSVFEFRIKSTP